MNGFDGATATKGFDLPPEEFEFRKGLLAKAVGYCCIASVCSADVSA